MIKRKINLQLFAGPTPAPTPTPAPEPTPTPTPAPAPAPKENMIPQSRLNDVITERDTYKTSLTQKDSEITALNEKLKAYEGYIPPTELEKVKTETEKAYQEKLESSTIQSKLEVKLVSEGLDAEFIKFMMSEADTTGMKLKDGKVIGLDDVVNGLKEQYPKMFGTKQPKAVGAPPAGAGGQTPNGKLTADEVRKLSNDDRIAYKKANPDWWKY